MGMKQYEFWFVVGSQFLYGPEVLETVAARAAEMAGALNASGRLPCKLAYKVTAKTNREISDVVREANHDPACAGIVTWCHTFSPSQDVDQRPGQPAEALVPPGHPVQPHRSRTTRSTWTS